MAIFPAFSTPAATAGDPPQSSRDDTFHDRLERVARQLELTDEQREKLKPLLQAEMERLRSIQADTSLSRRARLRKLKEIRADLTPKVKEILTAEQFKKWESIRKVARSEFRATRRRGRP